MASTQQRCNHSITRLSLEGSEQTLSITQQILEHHIISEHGLHVITRLSVRNSLNPNLNRNAFACPVAHLQSDGEVFLEVLQRALELTQAVSSWERQGGRRDLKNTMR